MEDTFAALVWFLFAEDRRNHPFPAEKSQIFLMKAQTHIRTYAENEEKEDQHG
jgi:hypothetical protein